MTRIVVFEETGEERDVIYGCKRCRVTEDEFRNGIWHLVVSKSGTAHHSVDYGMTACGLDATGDGWWWPL